MGALFILFNDWLVGCSASVTCNYFLCLFVLFGCFGCSIDLEHVGKKFTKWKEREEITKKDSMNKDVNQVQVFLQQCISGEFHDVKTCHFYWEGSKVPLNSVLVTRNENRNFYLSGLKECAKKSSILLLVEMPGRQY